MTTQRRLHFILKCAFFLCVVFCPSICPAQSLAIGAGPGLALMDYFTGQTDREYRITPELGYYPVLKTYENALGSIHFNASLLLSFELPVDIEIRFDMARMRWKNSKVTHVSCTPVDVVNGSFNDAIAKYVPLNDVDPECLNKDSYNSTEDISNNSMPSLWFFHISGGARYSFFKNDNWNIYAGAHLGLTISTTIEDNTWFGGNIDAILGVMYKLSEHIWIELDAKILFMITQVPQDSQTRINHETQTGGNIFTSLIQPNAYVDFQASVRFDFSNL